MRDLLREAMNEKAWSQFQRQTRGRYSRRGRRRRKLSCERLEDRTVLSVIGAAGIFVDVNNNGLVEPDDIDVTVEASDGVFDTDVSEGNYVARDDVGLIVNQAVAASQIDYRADELMTINADLASIDTDMGATIHDVTIVSRFSDVTLLDPTLASADDVTIESAGTVNLDDDTIIAEGPVSVTAGVNIDINNATLTSINDGVALTAGVDINGGTGIVSIVAAVDVNLQTTTGNLNLANPTLVVGAGDDIALQAVVGDINAQSGSYQAGDDVEMTAGGNLNVQNATIVSGDDVELTAGTDVGANDASIAAAEEVEIEAGGSINAPGLGILAGEDIEMSATTGDINISDTSTFEVSLGDIEMEADVGDINAQGGFYLAAGTLEMEAGGNINVQNAIIAAGDDVELEAGGDVGANDAIIAALDDVEIEAGGSINAPDVAIVAGEDVEIEAETGSINLAGIATSVDAGGKIEIEAEAGDINAQGGFYLAVEEIEMTAGLAVRASDAVIDAGDEVELTAQGGDVDANAAVITASGNMDEDDDEDDDREGDVNVVASGSINAQDVDILAAGDVVLHAMTGDINIRGPNNETLVVAGGDIKIEADAGDINAQEAIFDAVDDIALTAGGALHLQNITAGIFTVFVAGDDVTLKAKGGDVEAGDAFVAESGGNVKISARDSINAAGFEIHAVGDILFHAQTGDINMPDSPNFFTVLEAGDDVKIKAPSGNVDVTEAVLLAGDDVEVYAGGSISALGIDVIADDNVEFHSQTGDIDVSDSVDFDTSVDAGGNISMVASAGSIVGQGGTYSSLGGDVAMTAAVDVDVQNATLTAFVDVKLTAGNDLFVQMAVITAGNDILLTAGNEVFLQGVVLTAGGQIVIIGMVIGMPAP